jgi:hypothetical protein
MKSIKQIALGAVITLGVFCVVMYGSCSKDACKGVTCLNGATCSGGVCGCLAGTGGNNCETMYRSLYANGRYKGVAMYSIVHADTNNFLIFTAEMDSNYSQMKMMWTDTGTTVITVPITLTNNSVTGSDFNITPTPAGSYIYSGSGNVNGTQASVTLKLTQSNGQGQPVIVTLANFNRQ